MSDNDGAGFSPSQFVWASQTHDNNDNDSNDDDDVMVTMNNCETTALASLSLFFPSSLDKNKRWKKERNVKSDMIEITICILSERARAISNSDCFKGLFRRRNSRNMCVCVQFKMDVVQVTVAHLFP